MISQTAALRILDGIFGAATMLVLLVIAGLPTGWLLALADLLLRDIQWFSLAIVVAALWLIHPIARTNRPPRRTTRGSTRQVRSSAMPGSPFSIARR